MESNKLQSNKGQANPKASYDILIIGGGPAGLAAAMSIGRMGRSALVCDDDRPRNAPAAHMNNFPSQDGVHPAEWRRRVRVDLQKYATIHFHNGSVQSLKKIGIEFKANLTSQVTDQIEVSFKKVILAYGIIDTLPQIKGVEDLWGQSIFHCPFCHGYEVRGKRLAILSSEPAMIERMIPMIYQLSSDLQVFTNGPIVIQDSLLAALKNKNVEIIQTKIKELEGSNGELKAILTHDEKIYLRDGIFITPHFPFKTKSMLGDSLGCEKDAIGLYKIDETSQTTVPGVFAAGDIVKQMQSVIISAASGALSGGAAVHQIVAEEFFGAH